jgi:2-methylisocitrate lyase-like PEP mutase family enzyme
MDWEQAAAGTGDYHSYPITPGVGDVYSDAAVSQARAIWGALSVAGAAASAYHGYKRTQSVGWAFVWALCGSIAPVVTVPVAIAQGFGKPKRG